MAFKLADFRSRIRDLARGYLFEVEIIFPTIVSGNNEIVNILAKSHKLPGKTYEATNDVFFMGMQYKLASKQDYPQWKCSFHIDDNWDVYKKMKAWHETVHGTETNIAAFPAQYKSGINLYQLDNAGNRIVAVELNGAWPVEIPNVELNAADKTPVSMEVTWRYDYNVFKVQ